MNLELVGNAFYYAFFPFYLILQLLLYIIVKILSPFIYIAKLLQALCLWPLNFLAQFEALWYFFGVAILVGSVCGLLIYGTLRGAVKLFDLDRKPIPPARPAKGHDAASYRAARQAKKDKETRRAINAKLLASQPLIQQVVREARKGPIAGPTSNPLSPNTGTTATRSGLLQEVILEHTDEEDDSAF